MDLTSDTLSHPVVIWLVRIGYATVTLVGLWLAFFISGLARRQALKNLRIDTPSAWGVDPGEGFAGMCLWSRLTRRPCPEVRSSGRSA